jgi:hypothetical protein
MPPKPRYTEDDALKTLRKAAEDTDKYLSKRRYRQWRKNSETGKPSAGTIVRVLGKGWPECLEEAGIETDAQARGYTKKEINQALEQALDQKGKPLTKRKYREFREDASQKLPSVGAIANNYENWTDALEHNDIEAVGRRDSWYKEEDFIDAVREAADAKDEPLTQKEYKEYCVGKTNTPSDSTIITHGYSWREICSKADVQPGESGPNTVSRGEYLERAEEAVEDLEEPVETRAFVSQERIQEPVIENLFGGVPSLLEELGVDYIRTVKHPSKDEDVEEAVKQFLKNNRGRYGSDQIKEAISELMPEGKALPNNYRAVNNYLMELAEETDDVKLHRKENKGFSKKFYLKNLRLYKQEMQEHRDEIPEKYHEVFDRLVGRGVAPSSIVATVEYLENGDSQAKTAQDHDVTSVTIRSTLDKIREEDESLVREAQAA